MSSYQDESQEGESESFGADSNHVLPRARPPRLPANILFSPATPAPCSIPPSTRQVLLVSCRAMFNYPLHVSCHREFFSNTWRLFLLNGPASTWLRRLDVCREQIMKSGKYLPRTRQGNATPDLVSGRFRNFCAVSDCDEDVQRTRRALVLQCASCSSPTIHHHVNNRKSMILRCNGRRTRTLPSFSTDLRTNASPGLFRRENCEELFGNTELQSVLCSNRYT